MNIIPASLIQRRWNDAVTQLQRGSLEFVTPEGDARIYKGPLPGPHARFAVREWDVLRRIAARGDIGLGEEYIDGAWDTDNIENLMTIFLINIDHFSGFADGNFFNRLYFLVKNAILRRNSLEGSQRNIQAHYDVGNDFYSLWLDETMTYSSALFGNESSDLASAQRRKYDRILQKIPEKRASVLEIGCGWGGFAERAAQASHEVEGITISPAQYRFATDRLKGSADIRLEDYRKTRGQFDAIVSIEMFEAVGERYWPQYFHTLADRLKQGGRAVIQTITVRDELFAAYRTRSDFIRHYVFPGGMLPSLERFREEAEKAGLKALSVFSFGQDYARTLRQWSARMNARESEIMALGHDASFLRNWQFYLGMCAAAFAVERTDVAQVELVHA